MPLVKKSNREIINLFAVFKALCENQQVVFDPKIQKDVAVFVAHKFTAGMTMDIATNLSALRGAIEVYNEAMKLISDKEPDVAALRKGLLDHKVELDLVPISKSHLNIGQNQNNISAGLIAEILFLLVD